MRSRLFACLSLAGLGLAGYAASLLVPDPAAVHAPAANALMGRKGETGFPIQGEVARHLAAHEACDVRKCREVREIVNRLGLDRPSP